ncbi:translesion DNA synthesis-associated protein ImuA [Vibrio sp. SCSIO 43135]|uniref:translesion DNA synthesis-associated protein ImuA n=1 Tax=Vibrio sp. SCSIO 43135 TaxID=2819096 RepID=UPI002074D677|nr:translesion DNA synthesis-associated protein ImuA [Vibrio sp. SCSIO 43135]USD41991.1 translesion DNA synthesis-associated protein ImuA [Vibrio sp. SCSIO 43135]
MYELIEKLKQKQLVWQGSQTQYHNDYLPTGFELLDQKLEGGFPKCGVVELQSVSGIGELRLLLPHIKHNRSDQLSVFVQPPGYLCAEQLHHAGIDSNKVLLLYPNNAKEALWAAEQCLKSGACSNVCLWIDDLEVHHVRRLQVASEAGDCLSFLFKTQYQLAQVNNVFSLPVSLSMTLRPNPEGLEITITKRKGGWPQGSFVLNMSQLWPSLTLMPETPVVIPFPLMKQG